MTTAVAAAIVVVNVAAMVVMDATDAMVAMDYQVLKVHLVQPVLQDPKAIVANADLQVYKVLKACKV
jgi:hypothetical protein